ncbi:hypothetical protein ABW45_07970 [Stenotrophomonas maltophilia]|nr:hypothetical protein ABW45_07970 [Stenotrophomonas maltophilia]
MPCRRAAFLAASLLHPLHAQANNASRASATHALSTGIFMVAMIRSTIAAVNPPAAAQVPTWKRLLS